MCMAAPCGHAPLLGIAEGTAMVVAGAVGAVASLAGSIMSSSSQSKTAKSNYNAQIATNESNERNVAATNAANIESVEKTNEANYKLWQEQSKQQWDMWHAENEYNSPVAQRERLKQAGLNPILAMSNGTNTGQASSMMSPSPSPDIAPSSQPFLANAPIMQNADYSAVASSLANSPSLFYDLLSKHEDVRHKRNENMFDETSMPTRIASLTEQLEELKAKSNKTRADYTQMQLLNYVLEQSKQDLVMQNKFNWLNSVQDIVNKQEQVVASMANRDYQSFQIELSKMRFQLDATQAQAALKEIYKRIELLDVQRYNIEADTQLKDSQRDVNVAEVRKKEVEEVETVLRAYGIKLSNDQSETLLKYLDKMYTNGIRQENQDYWNPFHYVGSLLGGSAAAGIKAYYK